jgi:hypothetical protein
MSKTASIHLDEAMADVRAFLVCVEAEGAASAGDLNQLCETSDRICKAARELEKPVLPDTDFHRPDFRKPSLAAIENRFAVLADVATDGVNPWVDIHHPAIDLAGAMALYDASRKPESQWDLKFGFQTHWGMHLASLRIPLLKAIRTYST